MRTFSEQKVGLAHRRLGWPLRIPKPTRVLGGILSLALLCIPFPAHGVTLPGSHNVTLAWDPSPDAWVAGYALHHGTASGNYTVHLDVGNSTSVTVSNLTPGVTYYFVATAYTSDGLESLPSNEVSYLVPFTNNLPTIALISPVSGDSYTSPATINLVASVTSNGHTVTKVQFYDGPTLLGEALSSPYGYAWSNVSAGSYSPTANVIYDAGSTVTSSSASVTVTNPTPTGSGLPTVGLRIASTGQAVLTVTGQTGHTYDIEATEDFTAWTVSGTVTVEANGSVDFSDTNAASYAARYYRTRERP
jgi:hypothetical protein